MAHGKETPRQKMIGMMYLVLTSMLALNVSKDILDSFVLVDEGLFKTTINFAAKNQTIYAEFDKQMEISKEKVGPWQKKASEVREKADRLVEDMQELKAEIIRAADGKDAKAVTDATIEIFQGGKMISEESTVINDEEINAKDNNDEPAKVMMVNGKGKELKDKIDKFRDFVVDLVAEKDTIIATSISKSLSTADKPAKKRGEPPMSWEVSYFEHLPLIAVVTNLTKFQSDVRNVEAEITQHLLSQIDAGALKVNTVEALVLAKSSYVLQGSQYEARVILAAYDSLQKPEVIIGKVVPKKLANGTIDYEIAGGGHPLSYDASGKAVFRAAANNVGPVKWEGILRLLNPDGTYIKRPFQGEYQVGKAEAVVSATKMNVLYIGVDNPISISVSGVPTDKISARMTNGNLTRSGAGWVARPTRAGVEAVVTVDANIDGQTKRMGAQSYRVKTVPNPVAKVAGKIGGKIDKATLAAQMVVQAEMENFDFDLKFRVTEFSVSAVLKGFTQTKPTKGTNISADQKALINNLSKGSKVYFEDIKVVGPDGSTRELPAVAFTIN
ncbi:MAG: gliding motility protein GldM [Bacteroidales bacterium]|jgi:gliding motility-associated protein GldM|nr:gliding motility protein GldM [Bacteroidales bacterium]